MVEPLHYRLRFDSPAFLGDADQSARWRTPPLKALLRQWWRVAYAQDHGYRVDLSAMRHAEGLLFGHAWLEDDWEGRDKVAARRSAVRLRLNRWDGGSLSQAQWKPLGGVYHPEVQRQVAADLYLGYGPVILPKGGAPTLKAAAAIQAGEEAELSLLVRQPEGSPELGRIQRALAWMHHWGTLGGRSRNGWGSLSLQPLRTTPALDPASTPLRPWRQALAEPWAHAIGQDERGPLVWCTPARPDWRAAMTDLARLKIELRTSFKFSSGKNASKPEPRHWLSYPVTNHSVAAWGGEARLPNTLRFKLRRRADGQTDGLVFHMPALPSMQRFNARLAELLPVWQAVHAWLDREAATAKLAQRLSH